MLGLTVAGIGTVAASVITGENLSLTIRVSTALLLVPLARGFLQARPGPAWPNERERWLAIAGLAVLTVITLGNEILANLGYLQFLMMTALLGPVGIFYNTIRDATRED